MSASLTKRLWQLHSWLGLVCGLGLLVIGVTGSLLVFHDELDAWRFPQLYRVEPAAAGRQSYDALWTAMRRALPDEKITGWMPAQEPGRADGIYVSRSGEKEPRALRLDPYKGEVRGQPTEIGKTLSGWLVELHYSLLAGTTGTCIAGALAVLLLLLGGSGVWLCRGFWKSFFTLRWDRSARIFFSDLHKMVGISSAAFNLILGFTGAWWNASMVYAAWTAPAAELGPVALTPPPALDFRRGDLSLDALMARAERELPGYRATYIALPERREGVITFYGTTPTPNPLRGDYGSRLVFEVPGGALKQVVDMRRAGVWEKIGDSFALLHFGTFGAAFGPVAGVCIKMLWTALGLAPGVLAVSGFMIWRARRKGKSTGRDALAR